MTWAFAHCKNLMKRTLDVLARDEFDVLVFGAGAFGTAAADRARH
jgi:alkyl hydroperoxide reductase subunit AhpF